ncbi:NADP-reducing hydrogenase subunit HndA [compost metagenome]
MTPGQTPQDAAAAVAAALARHAEEAGALLPILHAVQDQLGYIPSDAVPRIAEALNLSRAEVHGVISYYHDFRSQPMPGRRLHICRAEACQAMGGEALLAHARQHLGCDAHGTSRDGLWAVEPAYCLGLCASSPALMLDGAVHARMTPQKLDGLVARMQEAA